MPEYTANADGIGTLRLLEAIRILGMEKKVRIYQASTSELYGKVQEVPQTETTPFYPRSPYAVAKMYAYWITVNYREAQDWVIVTNKTTSVRDFVRMAFDEIGVTLEFRGKGAEEVGIVSKYSHPDYQMEKGREVVTIDPRYFRPTEVDLLIGDASKAKRELGWVPEFQLKDLVNDMMASDLRLMQKDQYLKDGGYEILNYYE
jgi:GDP-D-mannose dehydratase